MLVINPMLRQGVKYCYIMLEHSKEVLFRHIYLNNADCTLLETNFQNKLFSGVSEPDLSQEVVAIILPTSSTWLWIISCESTGLEKVLRITFKWKCAKV